MTIFRLSEQVANQIAAGEVVERPASVVKELVENAIDAKASSIQIKIEQAGLKSIAIIDDGIGMNAQDTRMALERHATSKISKSEDLFRIYSLGFRGEALPSIAAVSEMTLSSSNGIEGASIYLQGGKIISEEASHLRQGTQVLVENLFYNTPARLKYIKSLQTELAQITNIVNRLALACPQIAFTYEHEGKRLLQTNGKGRVQEALAAIYGFKQAQLMVPIHSETLDFKVDGYIASPQFTRASKHYISFFINGRYFRNYALTQALIQGYGKMLMINRFPLAVIKITCDPQLLDVNVHPTKMEVRISQEEQLYQLLKESINRQFITEARIPEAMDRYEYADVPKENKTKRIIEAQPLDLSLDRERASKPVQKLDEQLSDRNFKNPKIGKLQEDTASLVEEQGMAYGQTDVAHAINDSTVQKTVSKAPQVPISDKIVLAEEEQHHKHSARSVWADVRRIQAIDEVAKAHNPTFPRLDYVGQAQGMYLVASDATGIYLLDQHAVQERIKYEYYRETIGLEGLAMQQLLLSEVFTFSNDEAEQIRQILPRLKAMQIELIPFGNNSFQLDAHPIWIKANVLHQTVEELIELALEDPQASVADFRHATAIMLSCKMSIKANHYLSDAEARQLIEDLSYCENPYNCSHGRPTMIHFKNYDIERMFKRIQDPRTDK